MTIVFQKNGISQYYIPQKNFTMQDSSNYPHCYYVIRTYASL